MADADDEMCIAALFEEPETRGQTSDTDSSSQLAKQNDSVKSTQIFVEDVVLGKNFLSPTKVESDTFKQLQEVIATYATCESVTTGENKNIDFVNTVQECFKISPKAVCLAGAHATQAIGSIAVLSRLLLSILDCEAFLNPCYAFFDSALKELVRAFRFSDLEAVTTEICPHVLEYLLKAYVHFCDNESNECATSSRFETMKNLTDLFSGLMLSQRHNPKLFLGLTMKIKHLIEKIPVDNSRWNTVEANKLKRLVIDSPVLLGFSEVPPEDNRSTGSSSSNDVDEVKKSESNRPMSPALKAQCSTIQEMGFTLFQARRALKEKKETLIKH